MRIENGYFAFLVFLIINTLIAIIYFLIALFLKKNVRRRFIIRSLVMLLAPGVGVLIFFMSWLFYRLFFKRDVDLSDVIFSKDRKRELVRTNEEQERNYVPMEEALEITDTNELRKLMLGVAQNDYQDSLSSIYSALNSNDTETAHYAASVLQDALNEFRNVVQKESQRIYEEMNEGKRASCITRITELARYMNQVLQQQVFSEVEQVKYTLMYDDIMEHFYEFERKSMTSEQYENVSLRLLDINEYERCEKWCDRAMLAYPNMLASYTTRIKLYFNSNRRVHFFSTLDELKKSSITIDKETLELIRAFQ